MPEFIEVRVTGADEAAFRMRLRAERLDDARPFWREHLLAVFREAEREDFATLGSSLGRPWPLLRRTEAPSTLVRTGRLRESLTSGVPAEFKANKKSAKIGTDVFYAKFLHRKRPMVGMNEPKVAELTQRYVNWITGRR